MRSSPRCSRRLSQKTKTCETSPSGAIQRHLGPYDFKQLSFKVRFGLFALICQLGRTYGTGPSQPWRLSGTKPTFIFPGRFSAAAR